MKKLIGVYLLLFTGTVCWSQTIINTERLLSGNNSKVYAITLSYNGTRGNSNTDQLDISPVFIIVKKKNEFKLFGGYSVLAESGEGILKSGFVHMRHNFKFSNRIKSFEFYQLQFNEVLLLNKREVFGAGLRFGMIKKDSLNVDFSIGLMRETEVLNPTTLIPGEVSETTFYRGLFVNSFKWRMTELISFDNVFYYQPHLKNFADYRFLNDLSLSVSITTHLGLITSLTTRFDSQPPGDLENFDNVLSLGFNMKFE